MDTATAESYDVAMETLARTQPDVLIVDVQGLRQGEDGVTFSQFNHWLPAHWVADPSRPVIYLLHKGARRPHFKVDGVVVKKPFPFERLGEVLRERLGQPRKIGELGIDLDLATNTLNANGRSSHLTNIEASLLAYLMEHEGEILQPKELLVDVWQYNEPAGAGTLVRAHVSNLRRKLRDLTGTDSYIQTIRGRGYRFVA